MNRLMPAIAICSLLFTLSSPCSYAGPEENVSDLTPEKLIAEHIKSIGSPTTLSSVKTRAFIGYTDVEFVQGIFGSIKGSVSSFVSDGEKLQIAMKYGDLNYPGEYIAYNGKDVSVGHISPGQRSPLGDFLFRFNGIMKMGFVGGTLSLAWPLLNADEIGTKLKYKKVRIEGRELHRLEWPIQLLGNVRIKMYFEPETFFHVRTDYVVRIKNDVSTGSSDIMSFSLMPESIYTMIERFDNFRKVSGMTLPHRYSIEYSIEGQGQSFIGHWTVDAEKWIFNRTFDEMIFEAQK
ncbi:MAG: hypothetical protein P8Z37_01655 [Acidobacteriota bacterium]